MAKKDCRKPSGPRTFAAVILRHPFYRFPFRFDVGRLRNEIEALPESAWCAHPGNFPGNTALPLVSTGGGINDDFRAPLLPTPWLAGLPYVRQVLAGFETLLGRARLMRLDAEAGVPAHVDANYYWRTHTRVHVPVTTHRGIQFHCDDQSVHMAEGEAWTFDNWRVHSVSNPTPTRRIHLVFDTVGSSAFWQMVRPLGEAFAERAVAYRPDFEPALSFEARRPDPVMMPGDVDLTLQQIADDAATHRGNEPAALHALQEILRELSQNWRAAWLAADLNAANVGRFVVLRVKAGQALKRLQFEVKLASNDRPAVPILLGILEVMIDAAALQSLRAPGVAPLRPPD